MTTIIPVIMSGGSGTRLWPLSTEQRPKQFHRLFGGATLIQETVSRLRGAHKGVRFADPVIIANVAHEALVAEQLATIGVTPLRVLLEPKGRNTAATAVVAALAGARLDPDALVLLAPADHVVAEPARFRDVLVRAAEVARDRICVFGITPSRPETGYGYIQAGQAIADGVFEVASFREKPRLEIAQQYLSSGGFFWNAGIFLFSPHVLLEEFQQAGGDPEIAVTARAIREIAQAAFTSAGSGAQALLGPSFASAPSLPLDIAVMERTSRAAVAPCDIGWADVGSWSEIWRLSEKDADANAADDRSFVLDGAGNLVRSTGPIVAIAGVEDLVVIATPEAVFVAPRDRGHDAKRAAEMAQQRFASPSKAQQPTAD